MFAHNPASALAQSSAPKKWWQDTELLPAITRRTSSDGTLKLLLQLDDGHTIEAAAMPMPRSWTVCVSTQVGCPVGCIFCNTGGTGFIRNLHSREILAQIRTVGREVLQTTGCLPDRLVFMGMGEPLLNLDALRQTLRIVSADCGPGISWRRCLVSTVGIPDRLAAFSQARLALPAISLHAPEQSLRDAIIPGARNWPLADIMKVLHAYPLPGRERIVIEYILIRDLNDSDHLADHLHQMLGTLPVKINLIACNPVPGSDLLPSTPDRIAGFTERLRHHGRTVFLRRSLGADIMAACGQLRHQATTPAGEQP